MKKKSVRAGHRMSGAWSIIPPCQRRLLPALISGLISTGALANPSGPTVVNGQVGFASPNAQTLNVTNSPGAIIHWQGFSIGAQETTRFIQQSAQSAVLNRVVGQDPSQILGSLLSNGKVFLINPNGILFGQDARVDTAGLIASTLNLADADFLAGRLKFEGDSGKIVNQGYIRVGAGGDVVLIAPEVENSGLITTAGGSLILAAGRKITLTSLNLDDIHFEVQAPSDKAINLGKLLAEGGSVGLFAGSIQQAGLIQATGLTRDADGRIHLVAQTTNSVSGTLDASGEQGGTIKLLGQAVTLKGATVNASGEAGGGEVLIGGNYQGQGPEPNSRTTTIDGTSVISADATHSGQGGRIIAWSDGTTTVDGRLSAKGGPQGGDGGFIETSGKKELNFSTPADVSAPQGKPGTWLLDPENLTIDGAKAATIETALNQGSSVSIQTHAEGSEDGNLIVAASISKTQGGDAGLDLTAHGQLDVNAGISSTSNKLNVSLTAGTAVNVNAGIVTNGGKVSTKVTGIKPIPDVPKDNNTPSQPTATTTTDAARKEDTPVIPTTAAPGTSTSTTTGTTTNGTLPIDLTVPTTTTTTTTTTATATTTATTGTTATGTPSAPGTATIDTAITTTTTTGASAVNTGTTATATATTPTTTTVKGTIDTDGGSITVDGGKTGKVEIAGTLDASNTKQGEKGGNVTVLGEEIDLKDTSLIDASGKSGGGTILIGGNFQGKGPEPNAKTVTVEKGAVIKSDATEQGDGGKVVVWADGTTKFAGAISAKGGKEGGDGGSVEVSGKGRLVYRGEVDVTAPRGEAGSLLLDPISITIANGTTPPSGTASTGPWSSSNSVTIYEATIEGFAGELTLTATDSITLQDLADNNLTKAAGGLTLEALGSNGMVSFEDPSDTIVTLGDNADINVQAGNALNTAGNAGAINIGNLTATGRGSDIVLVAGSGGITVGNVTTDNGVAVAGSGVRIGMTALNGGGIVAGDITARQQRLSYGDAVQIDLVAGGSIQTGALTVTALASNNGSNSALAYLSAVAGTAGLVYVTGPVSVTATVDGDGSDVASAYAAANFDGGNVRLGGNVTVMASAGNATSVQANATLDVVASGPAADIEVFGSVLVKANATAAGLTPNTASATAAATFTAGRDVSLAAVTVQATGDGPNYARAGANLSGTAGRDLSVTGAIMVTATATGLGSTGAVAASAEAIALLSGANVSVANVAVLGSASGLIYGPIGSIDVYAGANLNVAADNDISAVGELAVTARATGLTYSASADLDLAAGNTISVDNVTVTASGTGGLGITSANFHLNNGTLTHGSGDIVVTGGMGGMTIGSAATFNWSGGNVSVPDFWIDGVVNVQGGPTDTLNIWHVGSTGELNLISGGGVVGTAYDNDGTVNVAGGSWEMGNGSGGSATGVFTTAPGATLIFGAGSHDLTGATVTGGGIVRIDGSLGSAAATVSAAGDLSITADQLIVQGGTVAAADAILQISGNLTLNLTTLQVLGGTSGAATVQSSGDQIVNAQGVTIMGGTGTGASARLYSLSGSQTITASNAGILVQGGGGTGGVAEIRAGDSQTITINGGGNLTVQGGSGTGNGNWAQIISSSGAAQTFNLSGGNVNVIGGTAGTSHRAAILALSYTAAQTFSGVGGLTVQGGASGNGNYASVWSFGTQSVTAGAAGVLVAGVDNYAELRAIGDQTVNINSGGNLTVQGGGGAASGYAYVAATGGASQQAFNLTGGSVTVQGGTVGSNNDAWISAGGTTQTFNGVGGFTVQGGASGSNNDANVDAVGTQTITFAGVGGNVLVQGGLGTGNYAKIETTTGNQTITGATNVTVQGGASGTGNFAEISALGAAVTTTIDATTAINILGGGGTALDNNYARIDPYILNLTAGNTTTPGTITVLVGGAGAPASLATFLNSGVVNLTYGTCVGSCVVVGSGSGIYAGTLNLTSLIGPPPPTTALPAASTPGTTPTGTTVPAPETPVTTVEFSLPANTLAELLALLEQRQFADFGADEAERFNLLLAQSPPAAGEEGETLSGPKKPGMCY